MLKHTAILLLSALSFVVSGQMLPLSDHYNINGLTINPAFAGTQEALSMSISCRDQWSGFDDAPKSHFLSMHAPIAAGRVGLGLVLERNSLGIYKETSVMGNYAYRTEVYPGTLCLGLGFGLSAFRGSWQDVKARDDGDELLMEDPASALLPSFSIGSYFYTNRYYIGISLPYFLSHYLDLRTGKYQLKNTPSNYNYFLTGGYNLQIDKNIEIVPSVLIRMNPGDPVQIDYAARLRMKEKLALGMGYRSGNMIMALLEVRINYQILLAYSYDINTGKIGSYINNSHEIMLNYVFRYERNAAGPRQF